jgi:hypothetical protein
MKSELAGTEKGRTIAEQGFDERVANLGGLYGAGLLMQIKSVHRTSLTAHANQPEKPSVHETCRFLIFRF